MTYSYNISHLNTVIISCSLVRPAADDDFIRHLPPQIFFCFLQSRISGKKIKLRSVYAVENSFKISQFSLNHRQTVF